MREIAVLEMNLWLAVWYADPPLDLAIWRKGVLASVEHALRIASNLVEQNVKESPDYVVGGVQFVSINQW